MNNIIKSLFLLFLIPLNTLAEAPQPSKSDGKTNFAQDPIERSRQAIRNSMKEPQFTNSKSESKAKETELPKSENISEPVESTFSPRPVFSINQDVEVPEQKRVIQNEPTFNENTTISKDRLARFELLKNKNTPKSPFTLNLSEDGEKYLKFSGNVQVWGSYLSPNPGSLIGTTQANATTSGWVEELLIRRVRFEASGMLSDRVFLFSTFGGNNYSINNNSDNKNLVNILDLLGEYRFNNILHVGAGMTGWGAGTLRYSAQSSSSQLVFDGPIYQQHQNLSATFGNRNLSVYAKGEIANLKYRAAVTSPLLVDDNQTKLNAVYAIQSAAAPNLQWTGMLTYQFKDKETNETPYNKGTYLGTKDIFNVATGYLYQANGTYNLDNNGAVMYNNVHVWSVDAFYESPFSDINGFVLTLYGAYSKTFYGKNFVRYTGTPNISNADNYSNTLTPSIGNNTGNSFISVGTGNTFYGQVGITLPKSSRGDGRFQFYVAAEAGLFQSLNGTALIIDGGMNYYFENKLGSKLSIAYRSRPVFDNFPGDSSQLERRGEFLTQLQVSF